MGAERGAVRGARRSPRPSDVVLTVAAAAIALTALLPVRGHRDPDGWTAALLVASVIPILWRRIWPLPALVASWAIVLAYLTFDHAPFSSVLIGPLIGTYAVGSYATAGRDAAIGGAVSAAGIVGSTAIVYALGTEPNVLEVGFLALLFALAWIGGDSAKTRREHVRALEERAERLEREREAQAKAAVLAERTRIARELHDVVAHHVSVIVLQAAAARRVGGAGADGGADADGTLASIETTGRQALHELRTLLGALRSEGADAEREPQPSLERLGELIDRTRGSGLEVELSVEGQQRPLGPGLELSVYRIVQEALTNVLTHADANAASVRLRYDPEGVEVEVRDDGHGDRGSDGEGHGLVGMRERVALFGGTFDAGPDRDGGWLVRASLPLEDDR